MKGYLWFKLRFDGIFYFFNFFKNLAFFSFSFNLINIITVIITTTLNYNVFISPFIHSSLPYPTPLHAFTLNIFSSYSFYLNFDVSIVLLWIFSIFLSKKIFFFFVLCIDLFYFLNHNSFIKDL